MITERFSAIARRDAFQPRSWLTSGGRAVSPAGHGRLTARNADTTAKEVCRKQQAQCVAAVADFCTTWLDPAACERKFLHCCSHFTHCNVEPGLACIFLVE